jgi:3-dehydroquinate dehydratase
MICVSLAGLSFQECVKAISRTEFAEIRIDQLDFSDDQFRGLFAIKSNTVATCRPENIDTDRRLELLKAAIEAGAGYVDVEYESDDAYRQELVAFAKANNSRVIISYHNFEETPTAAELDEIITQSFDWGADRVKLAVMAQTPADCARIMGLYDNYSNLIAFCMGDIGAITRVAAPLLGADFTFAAYNRAKATAPGQLTVEEFRDIYEIV